MLPPEGSCARLTVEQTFLRAGLRGPRVAITSVNFHANLRLAAEGNRLAVAPRAAALAMREQLDLVLVPIDWIRDASAITLVWREVSLGNPALVALLECF